MHTDAPPPSVIDFMNPAPAEGEFDLGAIRAIDTLLEHMGASLNRAAWKEFEQVYVEEKLAESALASFLERHKAYSLERFLTFFTMTDLRFPELSINNVVFLATEAEKCPRYNLAYVQACSDQDFIAMLDRVSVSAIDDLVLKKLDAKHEELNSGNDKVLELIAEKLPVVSSVLNMMNVRCLVPRAIYYFLSTCGRDDLAVRYTK